MKRICIPIDMRNVTRIKSAGGVVAAALEKTETHNTPSLH